MIKVNEIVDKYGDYEVDEDKLKEILVKPKPKSVWDLKEGDKYFFIRDSGIVDFQYWDDTGFENNNRNLGNVFLTGEEAEFEVNRRKVETILLKYGRRNFKHNEYNYYLVLEYSNLSISSKCAYYAPIQGIIYFDTYELCQQAIDEAGIDNIKKYIFGVSDDE